MIENKVGKANDGTQKELAVLIPLAVTGLALLYDVGYFYMLNVNYIRLFSLSEHLVFSLEALPLALAAVLVAIFVLRYPWLIQYKEAEPLPWKSWGKFVEYVCAFAVAGLAYHLISKGIRGWGAALASGALIWEQRNARFGHFDSVARTLMVVLGASATAFAFGLDTGEDALRGAGQVMMLDDDTKVQGRMVRSGENVVLFFETLEKKALVVRWEHIKNISSRVW